MKVSVTIGRNIGTKPMSTGRWTNFQWCVVDQLWLQPHPTYTYHTGEWEGVAEESVTITGETGARNLCRWARLARAFSQDAIAVRFADDPHWSLVKSDGTIEKGWGAS